MARETRKVCDVQSDEIQNTDITNDAKNCIE